MLLSYKELRGKWLYLGQNFLLADLREFFFRFRVKGGGGGGEKASKKTS